MQQKHFWEFNTGNLDTGKIVSYTHMQIIIGGLNIGKFIHELSIAKFNPHQYFLIHSTN